MQRARINLYPNTDTDGRIFHVGKLKSPITLNFKDGIAFLVYLDTEEPELHFGNLDNPDFSDAFNYYKDRRPNPNRNRNGNLPIELNVRYEKDPLPNTEPRKFYIGKIQFSGTIDCSNGVIFLAFTSDPNEEEIQIAVVDPTKTYTKRSQRVTEGK